MNYPVTTPFGHVAGYPLNNGFHNGIDYGYPMGTPVIVNGVTIGLSNNTGATTGPHLHVGKFVNGVVQDPGVGNGFQFDSAVIFDTGFDSSNGNYVRIAADGVLWNYLHLEKVLVSQGQELKGGNPPQEEEVLNEGDVINLYKSMLGRDPSQDEINIYNGKDWKTVVYAFLGSDEFKNRVARGGSPTKLTPGLYQV